jgi:undecaprenyl-diphosphatase
MIIVATIPTALIGFAFQESFEQQFGDAHFAAVCLLITGALLFISDRVRVAAKSGERIGAVQALIVGIAQGIAIIPGISRSGATIAAGIFSGIERSTAARFSFLLSIPAILGACILEASSFLAIRATDLLPYALGVIVAFISGFLSIDILLRVTAKRHLWHFSVYLLVVGLLGFILT